MHPTACPQVRYVGFDVHKHLVVIGIIDDRGTVLARHRCACTHDALAQFARRGLRPTDKVALEATTHTWQVVTLLTPFVAEVVVSHPLKTRAIAEAKIKTDKGDAVVLAQLLRGDFLPWVWEPPAPTQRLRQLTARRATFVMDTTAVKHRMHAILHQHLIPCSFTDLFCVQGRQWLTTRELDAAGRTALESDLRLLGQLEAEIAQQEKLRAEHAYADAHVKLLMTLPGVSHTVAQTVLAVLGEVTRFRDGHHAASHLGLVPRTHQSAQHGYHGAITTQGHRYARALLVQAAQHVATHPGPLGAFFRRLAQRKGRNVAVVATAWKLVVMAWHVLRHHEPYRYAQPTTVQTKLNRLWVTATGERRPRGGTKGQARPTTYGGGQRYRKVPA